MVKVFYYCNKDAHSEIGFAAVVWYIILYAVIVIASPSILAYSRVYLLPQDHQLKVLRADPDGILFRHGRSDMIALTYQLVLQSNAEVVIISNPPVIRKVVD